MPDAEFEQIRAQMLQSLQSLIPPQPSIDTPPDPMEVVTGSVTIHAQAETLLAAAVDRARRSGCTWSDIGDALGITRQGAFQRFGRPIDPRTGAPMDRTPLPGAQPRALALFALISAAQWEAARTDFDATMVDGLSADKLASAWAAIVSDVGDYEHAGAPTARRKGDYTIVHVPLSFEAGEMIGRVMFDGEGKVAGLQVLSPSAVAHMDG